MHQVRQPNRAAKFSLALVIVLMVGCHSVPLRSPVDPNLTVNSQWLKKYKEARAVISLAPDHSCQLFKELGQEPKFPAKDLAKLRAWEVCAPKDAPDSFKDVKGRDQLPSYLQEISLDIALKNVVKTGDKDAEMELANEKSKGKLSQSEKLKWIQLAMQRARESKNTAKLAEYTKRQFLIAPRLNPVVPESKYLSVANDFRFNRKFEPSREYYEKVLQSPNLQLDDKVAAHKGLRMTYKNARDHESHLQASLKLVKYLKTAEKLNPKSNAVRAASYDSEVYYGRALWTLGRADEAKATFLTIERRFKNKLSLAELYWLLGRMAEETGDFKEVTARMEMALKERITDPELRDKILWYSAWNERRQKNFVRAAEILTELEAQTQADFTRVRSLYWLGKTYSEMNKPEEAKVTLERLTSLDPLGYYGLLAHRHLGLAISFKRNAPESSTENADANLPLDAQLAEWLVLLEEKDPLNALLEQSADAYRKQKIQSNEGWIALFKYYARGGLYAKLYASLAGLPTERRKSIVENQPEMLFPQPWNDDVKMAALNYSVDEGLIYSIMRQESAFDPKARSGADAFGLMQVLPEIAEDVAKENKVPYAHMDDLFEPAVNIPVGAAHIRELLKRHKGQFILAVAAYNASEKAIAQWMKMRYRGDSLEFIEEIPYEETRVYVRLVMRNLIFYSLLKSKSASIEFPERVLKLDAT